MAQALYTEFSSIKASVDNLYNTITPATSGYPWTTTVSGVRQLSKMTNASMAEIYSAANSLEATAQAGAIARGLCTGNLTSNYGGHNGTYYSRHYERHYGGYDGYRNGYRSYDGYNGSNMRWSSN